MTDDFAALLERGRTGDKRAVARLISLIEQGGETARSVLTQLWPHTGRARIFGITGPPGAGKSTLTNALTKCWRAKGLRVGIIAVDPTSPFTGGAILGDRVRMGDLTLDTGVFIRSMGTRGQLGGLSPATAGAVHALDACGYDLILLETVGVGQSEVAVMEIADLVLVLNVPGLGDDVQAIKAGILEIGDLFAVNKADRPGADRTANELRAMLELGEEKRPLPVLLVSASQGTGVTELCEELERQYLLPERERRAGPPPRLAPAQRASDPGAGGHRAAPAASPCWTAPCSLRAWSGSSPGQRAPIVGRRNL
ncbi:methylmalonyl Co-A mutase-associated GTPase MeaB [Flavonifractor plautii]|nr:methylmalonyl Co-A mutase-associated GTPase MeaB [Flavonifractor plautii]